ncbi:MAG TPA: TonB-dependent receptor [Gemmatimonadaceae bacterium]
MRFYAVGTIALRVVCAVPLFGSRTPLGAQGASMAPAVAHVTRDVASTVIAMQDSTTRRGMVTLTMRDARLGDILTAIAQQTGRTLMYSSDVVDVERRASIDVHDADLATALDIALRGTNIAARLTDHGRIVLDRARAAAPVSRLTGRVIDAADGRGIAQATVALRNTRHAVLTSEDGRFVLADIESGTHELEVRRIGYVPYVQSLVLADGQDTTLSIRLTPSPSTLDKVIVTGTILPTEVKAIPTPVTVVDGGQIAQQGFRHLDQAIRMYVPTALAFDNGPYAEQENISVRGASSLAAGSPIKVYVDGIEVASDDFAMIDPASIDRVEIIRGPQAATIYGSDAIGGVMQIFTKHGSAALDRPEVNLDVSLGDVQSAYKNGGTLRQAYSATINGGTPSASYTIGGSYTHTGDWLPYYYLSTPSAFGAVHIAQDKLSVDLSGRFMNTQEATAASPFLVKSGVSSPLPTNEPQEYRQSTLGTRLTFDATARWRHTLTLGVDGLSFDDHNSRPRFTTPDDSLMFIYVGELRKMSVGYNTSLSVPISPSLTGAVTAGVEYYQYTSNQFNSTGAHTNSGEIVPDSTAPISATRNVTTNTGVFGQAQLNVADQVFLTLGVRAEHNNDFGSRFGTPVSPRFGASWARTLGRTTVKLRASYGQAIRPPNPLEKGYSKNAFIETLANESLGPERQRGFDGGVDIALGRITLSASYYDQTATDLIQFVLIDGNRQPQLRQFENVGRVANRGIELEAGLQMGPVNATAQFAHATSVVKALGPAYTGDLQPGDQVLGIPHNTAGASVAWSALAATTLTLGVVYVGARTNYDDRAFFTDPSRSTLRDYWTEYPAFTKLNLGVSHALSSSTTAFVSIENVANVNPSEQSNLTPIQGRISMVGVRLHY